MADSLSSKQFAHTASSSSVASLFTEFPSFIFIADKQGLGQASEIICNRWSESCCFPQVFHFAKICLWGDTQGRFEQPCQLAMTFSPGNTEEARSG